MSADKYMQKHLLPYINYSNDFYEQLKQERLNKIEAAEQSLADPTKSAEVLQDFIDTWKQELQRLEQQYEDGRYVDAALCNEAGVTVDWKRYYEDRAAGVADSIEQIKKLLGDAPANAMTDLMVAKRDELIAKHQQMTKKRTKRDWIVSVLNRENK